MMLLLSALILIVFIALKLSFAFGYWQGTFCKSKKRLDGKRVIVTGANGGIGYEITLDLARRGATVILACRNLKAAEESRARMLMSNSSMPATLYYKSVEAKQLIVKRLDLSSLESIKLFSREIRNEYLSIDILICNAAISDYGSNENPETKEGFPLVIGTNHLGHFYLVNQLIDLILKEKSSTNKGRIVIVSSKMHYMANFDAKNMFQGYLGSSYSKSKLANVAFGRELANRYKDGPLIISSLHPGLIATQITRHNPINRIIVHYLLNPFTKSKFAGAQTVLHCVLDENIFNGGYYSDCVLTKPSWKALDNQFCKTLWEESEKLLKI